MAIRCQFTKEKLQYGDYIQLMNEKGEMFDGTFENEINDSSFTFSNFSNGQIETYSLEKLQHLKLMARGGKQFF